MTYFEKLKDPRWQRLRLEIMQRDNFTCQHCSSKTKTLNVHHKCYKRGAAPWEYEKDWLITVCEDCHTRIETLKDDLAFIVADLCGSNSARSMKLPNPHRITNALD
jgi:5-methylcytosine-specific restriction endonuclease McrA